MPVSDPQEGLIRLQKVLAAAGVSSRRGAEVLIRQLRVTVYGRTAQIGASVRVGSDVVKLDGERLGSEPLCYWLVHKPLGVLSTVSDPHGRRTVV